MTARDSQPVRAPSGLDYGERKQLTDAQRAAPLPDNRGGQPAPPPGGGPGGGGGRAAPVVDVFGETDNPSEPATAGAALGPGSTSLETLLPPVDDAVETLRALVVAGFGGPGVRRMLERAAGQGPL